jgi:hypothetical protein
MKEPAMATDGQCYERSFIEQYFEEGNEISPVTGKVMMSRELLISYNLKSMIMEWEAERQLRPARRKGHADGGGEDERGDQPSDSDEESEYSSVGDDKEPLEQLPQTRSPEGGDGEGNDNRGVQEHDGNFENASDSSDSSYASDFTFPDSDSNAAGDDEESPERQPQIPAHHTLEEDDRGANDREEVRGQALLKHNDIIDDREEAQEQELVKRDDIIDDREEIREEALVKHEDIIDDDTDSDSEDDSEDDDGKKRQSFAMEDDTDMSIRRGIWSFSVGKMVHMLVRHAMENEDDSHLSTRLLRERAMDLNALAKADAVRNHTMSFSEDRTSYYALKIQRPVDVAPVHDEGIFVWFQEGSVIESDSSKIGVSVSTRRGPDDVPRVAFYENKGQRSRAGSLPFAADVGAFGESLSQKMARSLVESNVRPARMHGKSRNSFLGFNGTPGNGLPSIKEPLFIKGSDLSCLMAVHCPPGFERPSFTVCACYAPTPPLKLYRTKFMRTYTWTCNVLIFGCLCCIILMQSLAAYAFLLFLLVVVVLVGGTLASKIYWKGERKITGSMHYY